MKKITSIFVLLVLLALVGGGIAYWQGKQKQMADSGMTSLQVTVTTLKEHTPLFDIRAEYPTFAGYSTVNARIQEDIAQKIEAFKKESTENWNERRNNDPQMPEFPDTPFSFILRWSAQQMNSSVVSFACMLEQFTGGANVFQDIMTYSFDMADQKPVDLAALFPNDPDYLSKVSVYVGSQLTDRFGGMYPEMVAEGTLPLPENFSRFTFDDASITFYFPKYQVAPGAAGEQLVIMSRKAL